MSEHILPTTVGNENLRHGQTMITSGDGDGDGDGTGTRRVVCDSCNATVGRAVVLAQGAGHWLCAWTHDDPDHRCAPSPPDGLQ